jgi:hypothetical protein
MACKRRACIYTERRTYTYKEWIEGIHVPDYQHHESISIASTKPTIITISATAIKILTPAVGRTCASTASRLRCGGPAATTCGR